MPFYLCEQLTLERSRLELCTSTVCAFPFPHKYTFGCPCPWLQTCGCREPTVCIVLCYFRQGLGPLGFSIQGNPGTHPSWVLGGVRGYMCMFDCVGIGVPNHCISQGHLYFYKAPFCYFGKFLVVFQEFTQTSFLWGSIISVVRVYVTHPREQYSLSHVYSFRMFYSVSI